MFNWAWLRLHAVRDAGPDGGWQALTGDLVTLIVPPGPAARHSCFCRSRRTGRTRVGPVTALHLVAEPVGALGVVGADHAGQTHHGPFGIKTFVKTRAEEFGERATEQRRPQVIQFRQP